MFTWDDARMISLWGGGRELSGLQGGARVPNLAARGVALVPRRGAEPGTRIQAVSVNGERYPLSFRLRLQTSVLRVEQGHLLGKTAATETFEGGRVSDPEFSGNALDACPAVKHPPIPRPRGVGMIASWGGRRTGWVGHLASGELFLLDDQRPVFNAGWCFCGLHGVPATSGVEDL